jgi:hypothetical protein
METKQERRERRAKGRRKMRVSGKSVLLLQALAQQRAAEAERRLAQTTKRKPEGNTEG